MQKLILSLVILAAGFVTVFHASPALAQAQAAREKCCKEMGGQWREADKGRGGIAACFSLPRGSTDAFYACAANGGSSKKK
jgi:hypothetical protein